MPEIGKFSCVFERDADVSASMAVAFMSTPRSVRLRQLPAVELSGLTRGETQVANTRLRTTNGLDLPSVANPRLDTS